MTPPADKDPFFMGWATCPTPLRGFLLSLMLSMIAFGAFVAYVIAATQNDPGAGGYMGVRVATGILQAAPYPVLHVTESPDFPSGTALILSGGSKIGVQAQAAPLDGALARVRGVWLSRGALNGLQVGELAAAEGIGTAPPTRPLGRWRLTGEICDGKCLNGTMRPGTGLAHKACANLCLIGGVPPVFVATDRIEGSEFLLLAGPDGGPLPPAMLDYTALLIEAEGTVEKRGALLVFRLDPATVRQAR